MPVRTHVRTGTGPCRSAAPAANFPQHPQEPSEERPVSDEQTAEQIVDDVAPDEQVAGPATGPATDAPADKDD